MWATADFVPCSEELGTSKTAGVMLLICPLWATVDFVPRSEALGTPQNSTGGKGEKALPSAPHVPRKKVKGENALPSAPRVAPPASKEHTRSIIPSETDPLGVGDWLTDKDILCWLNQEVYHMEIDE